MLDRRDADWGAPVGATKSDAGHLQGMRVKLPPVLWLQLFAVLFVRLMEIDTFPDWFFQQTGRTVWDIC